MSVMTGATMFVSIHVDHELLFRAALGISFQVNLSKRLDNKLIWDYICGLETIMLKA